MSAVTICVPSTGSRPPARIPVVHIVDDDVSVREGIETLVVAAGWHPETFSSAEEFLSHPPACCPSCLILDVGLPDFDGLELQRRVAEARSEMPIIFITGCGDVATSVQAMKAGAIEFLLKPFAAEALRNAIGGALQRSRELLREKESLRTLHERYLSLSRRERQVMILVVRGLLNKEIGGALGISEITVKAHRANTMRKMLATSLPDLVNSALRLGLSTSR